MLGIRIAVLRCEQGLSQAQLARRLHISASAVGMYEQGRRAPSLQLVVQLAREFGVTTDYLLTGSMTLPQDDKSHAAEEKRETLLRLLQQLSQQRGSCLQ